MTPGCRNSRRSAHNPGSPNRQEPEGPAAKARTRYVFGHILVADETLGRYLVEGKSVRHINGVRDDNRPENLELWTKPQPSGVRVSDASEWARHIYDLYVADGSPPTGLTLPPEHSWR